MRAASNVKADQYEAAKRTQNPNHHECPRYESKLPPILHSARGSGVRCESVSVSVRVDESRLASAHASSTPAMGMQRRTFPRSASRTPWRAGCRHPPAAVHACDSERRTPESRALSRSTTRWVRVSVCGSDLPLAAIVEHETCHVRLLQLVRQRAPLLAPRKLLPRLPQSARLHQ
eukprot:590238-Rhodomonas_salina.1